MYIKSLFIFEVFFLIVAYSQPSNFRGIHHFGLTVPNVTEAVIFFEKVFDCNYVLSMGPFTPQADWMNTHLNVAKSAIIPNISFVRCGNGSNLEIFQYDITNQSKTPANNSDYDGHHLAFYVDDIDLALEKVKKFQSEEKINIMEGPSLNQDPASGGLSWIYLTTSWGLQLELVSAPKGMSYENTTTRRLWSPNMVIPTFTPDLDDDNNKKLMIAVIVLAITTVVLPIATFFIGLKRGIGMAPPRELLINENNI
jgi:catechol 2,3-dioxygenase-like lactoylglutathione lyase family enzyme